ncbi:hypothetical protein BDN70DRAFT_76782 [Pholiota conissans]|uniref:Uncharacterized protein n=1 Tax=Pholiota conissans TaxID=109636 RepID=A0A9P6CS97_9AGAR|nr:hypothetical protein BDN70DRAFT_76782 [Pholiota conissans]
MMPRMRFKCSLGAETSRLVVSVAAEVLAIVFSVERAKTGDIRTSPVATGGSALGAGSGIQPASGIGTCSGVGARSAVGARSSIMSVMTNEGHISPRTLPRAASAIWAAQCVQRKRRAYYP